MYNLYYLILRTQRINICVRNVAKIDVSMCTNYSRAARTERRVEARFSLDTALSRIQFGISNIPIPALRTRSPLSLNYMYIECLVYLLSANIIQKLRKWIIIL